MRIRTCLASLLAACCGLALSFALFPSPARAGLDEWVSVGPLGGTVYSLAAHPTNADILYAPVDGALYFTEDGGATWSAKPACPAGVSKIYIVRQNPGVMYAQTSGALHKSIDAGETWNQIASSVGSFAYDPNYPERLFIGSYGTVRKSVDGGATWIDVSPDTAPWIGALAVSPGDSATVYAGAVGDGDVPGQRVYKTTDGGLSWSYSNSGLPQTDISGLLVDPSHPDTIFAATTGYAMYWGYGLYRSTDAGLSWSAANTGLPCESCPYNISIQDMSALSGRSGEFCVVANCMSFRSVDGGDSWTRDAYCVDDPMLTVEFYPGDPDTVFFGCGSGLWRLTPTSCDRHGVVPIDLSEIAIDASTSTLFAAGDIAYISRDGGLTWELSRAGANWGTATALAINPIDGNILFVGDYNRPAEVYRSDNGGISWDTTLADMSVNAIEIDPVNPSIVYVGGLDAPGIGGLFKSTDSGISWTKILSSVVTSVAIDPIDDGTIYIGTYGGGIRKSSDGGTTWVPINSGLPSGVVSRSIPTIAIDPLDPDILYLGTTSSGIYRSTNGGEEWTPASTGLAAAFIWKIVIDYLRPSILYAQSSGAGVFRSIDGARNWEPLNAGLTDLSLGDLIIDPVSPNVLYCCGASGMFRYESSFDPATDAGSSILPPISIESFPNPFSGAATVEYALTGPAHVRIVVYDVAGRVVKTLVDQRLEAGLYRTNLPGKGLSAGVYFIEGKFGNRTVTKKCILVK